MTDPTSPDDHALRWDGDDDPTLRATPDDDLPRPPSAALPDRQPVVTAREDEPPVGAGNVALVAYGIIGGIYALWTVGWVLGAMRLRARIEGATGAVADFMFLGSMVLAVAAPAVWFLVAIVGTRGKRPWQRFLWLGLGVLLLVPWPFVMVGVLGQ